MQQAVGLNVPGLYSIENGKAITSANYRSEKEIQSRYGMAQLSWDDWAYLDVTARNDWSSTLPQHNRSIFYPSVSVGYLFSEMLQSFGTNIPSWWSYGKLRASYAQIGNDTDPYQLTSTLTLVYNMEGGNTGVALPQTPVNKNLIPE